MQQGASILGRYGYDSEGLRIFKIGDDGVRRYTYDQLSVVTEADQFSATVSKYDYGLDQLVSLQNTVEGRSFFHLDFLGSTANLTDGVGATRRSILYDAWGDERDRVGTSANNFTFTGHEKDGETGLIYAKARFYDPDIGRFLTQDPLLGNADDAPTLHRYAYVESKPLLYMDPTGMAPVVGQIYQLEVVINGQRRIYTGKANNLKRRLTRDKHTWRNMIRDKRTKISYKNVRAELNEPVSGQRTFKSARNEALLSAEQKEMDLKEKSVSAENQKPPKGRKRTVILNEDPATVQQQEFRKRHKVTMDRKWKTIKEPGGRSRYQKV